MSASVAECESEPLTPCAVIEKAPVGAVALAPTTNGTLAPAATLNMPEGFVAKPEGRPLSVSCTEPLKPFCGATETVMRELVACESDSEVGESEMAKSAGGESRDCTFEEELLPPQPAHTKRRKAKNAWSTACGDRRKEGSVQRARRRGKQD